MEILKNVDAPWSIDLSTPFIEIKAYEIKHPDNISLQVEFCANLGHHRKALFTSDYYTNDWEDPRNKVVERTTELYYKESDYEEYQFQRIQITFSSFYAFRVLPPQTDQDVIDESKYSWEMIKFDDLIKKDWERWKTEFRSAWQQTNVCPDCRMYEVLNSKWLRDTGVDKRFGCKHFLILGHDLYVEVLAETWKWESIGALTNW